jgi:hypothetical protein
MADAPTRQSGVLSGVFRGMAGLLLTSDLDLSPILLDKLHHIHLILANDSRNLFRLWKRINCRATFVETDWSCLLARDRTNSDELEMQDAWQGTTCRSPDILCTSNGYPYIQYYDSMLPHCSL